MSILGFYKEGRGPEELVGTLKEGEGGGLYIELPSSIRNRMEIVVGNKVKCALIDKNGHKYSNARGTCASGASSVEDAVWEVAGYWNELHIPPDEVARYGLRKGDQLRLLLKSVIQWGEEFPI